MGTEQNCCRKQPVVLGSDRFWLLELRVSRTFLDQLQPQLFRPWIPNSRHCLHFCPRSGRFRLYELRVSRTFLDFLRLICSVHGYTTQGAANTSCPSSDRFRLRELRESQHFSTFYGPSVQSMDTQLGARQRGADPGGSRFAVNLPLNAGDLGIGQECRTGTEGFLGFGCRIEFAELGKPERYFLRRQWRVAVE